MQRLDKKILTKLRQIAGRFSFMSNENCDIVYEAKLNKGINNKEPENGRGRKKSDYSNKNTCHHMVTESRSQSKTIRANHEHPRVKRGCKILKIFQRSVRQIS
jgi:hypothetical protein